MNVALRRAMTVDEYLAWSDSQSERQRTELINGQIVMMAPERATHNRLKIAVIMTLRRAITAARVQCEAFTDGMVVRIDEHTAYEPDALVNCGDRLSGQAMVVPHPVVVVEILSATTRHTDTSAKLIGYFKLPSVAHYLILDADDRSVTHHARDRIPNVLRNGPLRLDPPGLNLTVEDLLDLA